MEYSMAQAAFDEAVSLYEKGQFKAALSKLYQFRKGVVNDPDLAKNISRYMAKCLVEIDEKRA